MEVVSGLPLEFCFALAFSFNTYIYTYSEDFGLTLFGWHQWNYIFPHDLCLLGECRVVCILCESAELQEHSNLQQAWLKGFLATKKSEEVMTDGDAPL